MGNLANGQQQKALQLIDRFKPIYGESFPAFHGIDSSDFVVSLRELIQNPEGINQGSHPLCGIACALKIAAELDPVNLVKMAMDLYSKGEYGSGSFLRSSIKVPKQLKSATPSAGHNAANSVLQTTIKSFYNPLTGYNNRPGSKFNEWQGITFPYQLRRFLTYYFQIERIPARTYLHTVQEIKTLLDKGVVIMALTSWHQMVKPGAKFKLFQQHYVLIRGIERFGQEVHLIIDNPRKYNDKLQVIKFDNETQCYKALIGIYGFKRREK